MNALAAVNAARKAHAAAVARGVRNPAPRALIQIIAQREIKTVRFTLAEGEKWNVHYTAFGAGFVTIGFTTVPLSAIRIVGLAYPVER